MIEISAPVSGIQKTAEKRCLCGCGKAVRYSFVRGHVKRGVGGFDPEVHLPRLCLCGCGQYTRKFRGKFNRFIRKHENRGRVAWNRGRPFPTTSRLKMRLARLGKEPANKIPLDERQLFDLYVRQKKNSSEVSNILGVSGIAVKNRIRHFGWRRTTRASCQSVAFREKMRVIRVGILAKGNKPGPNRLEQLVYNELDRRGIHYYQQYPLYDKFVADAFIPEHNMVLEIFGRYWHELPQNKVKDFSKKRYLEKCGHNVREIWDYEIKKDIVATLDRALLI